MVRGRAGKKLAGRPLLKATGTVAPFRGACAGALAAPVALEGSDAVGAAWSSIGPGIDDDERPSGDAFALRSSCGRRGFVRSIKSIHHRDTEGTEKKH